MITPVLTLLPIDREATVEKITDWIRSTVFTSGFTKIVIGVSGGVDSAVCASLAARALGSENIYPVFLPYGRLQAEERNDAYKLLSSITIPEKNITQINIKKTVDTIFSESESQTGSIRKGNIMARIRMVHLFDLAKKLDALVCGTENKTEYLLGYFTRYGDGASDLEPITSLYKTHVWDVAKYLKIPAKIINKSPTAGLWKDQTDENELGFTYKAADYILYNYFDLKVSAEDIIQKGIEKDVVVKVLERVAKNDFKHHLPYVFK